MLSQHLVLVRHVGTSLLGLCSVVKRISILCLNNQLHIFWEYNSVTSLSVALFGLNVRNLCSFQKKTSRRNERLDLVIFRRWHVPTAFTSPRNAESVGWEAFNPSSLLGIESRSSVWVTPAFVGNLCAKCQLILFGGISHTRRFTVFVLLSGYCGSPISNPVLQTFFERKY